MAKESKKEVLGGRKHALADLENQRKAAQLGFWPLGCRAPKMPWKGDLEPPHGGILR